MKNFQALTDKVAIGLSVTCTIHCLAFPLIIIFLPAFAALPLADEAFHIWMVIAVVPTSGYALTLGCKQHKRYQLLGFGAAGLLCLILAAILGEERLGEAGEKTLTTIGAMILAYGHYRNYRLCQERTSCACSEQDG
ncbi:MAG: MerC domain-containing protein [Pseudomonadota bacterium]